MIHLVPTTKNVNALEMAKIFYDNIFRLHGIPNVIVNDRDPRFNSIFWRSLFKALDTKLAISTTFHP